MCKCTNHLSIRGVRVITVCGAKLHFTNFCGKNGVLEHGCVWIPHSSLKIHTFLDIKHVCSDWVADAASSCSS